MHPQEYLTRLVTLAILALAATSAPAATITWTGVNGIWTNNALPLQWNPADEPDADDTARFNTNVDVTLGSPNEIAGLVMSGGAFLNTDGHGLLVAGGILVGATGTILEVATGSNLFAETLAVATGGQLQMSGGTVLVEVEKTPNGSLTIGADSALRGFGNIGLADAPTSATVLMRNDGTLRAVRPPPPPTNPPSIFHVPDRPGTLQISAASVNARIDLDGTAETGLVAVQDNQTLDLNVPMADVFNGSIQLQRNSVFDSSAPWTLAGGSILASNVGIGILLPFSGPATIRGGPFTQTGGTITIEEDSSLEIAADFIMTGGSIISGEGSGLRLKGPVNMGAGSIVSNGLLSFEADTTVGASTTITLGTDILSSMTVASGATVTINCPFINNNRISSQGTLNLFNSGIDYDGTTGDGRLSADNGGILNLRAIAAGPFNFGGRMSATAGGLITVGAPSNVHFLQGSNLFLSNGGAFRTAASSLQFSGSVAAQQGTSVIDHFSNFPTQLGPTMTGNISGNLLFAAGVNLQAGATFSGTGSIEIPSGKSLTVQGTDLVNIHVVNGGNIQQGVRLKSYRQTETGRFTSVLSSTAPGQFGQLVVNGDVTLAGSIKAVPGNGYTPVAGDTFDLITANSINGSVILIQPHTMPSTLAMSLVRTSASVRVVVVPIPPYQVWARSIYTGFGGFAEERAAPGVDDDRDGRSNFMEFALDGNPASAANRGKLSSKILSIGGIPMLTFTMAVRTAATADPADAPGGELGLRGDGVSYRIQASADLVTFGLNVTQVTGAEVNAHHATLPIPTTGWSYRTFRSPGLVTDSPAEFMRAIISE